MPSRSSSSTPRSRRRKQRKVALLIETSNAYARGLVLGVVAYIREHVSWSICLMEAGRGDPPPSWLEDWDGDGIIARIENRRIARAVTRTGLPAVDVSAGRYLPMLPRVEADDRAIAKIAADHLVGRGFQHLAYCGDDRFEWSRARGLYFEQMAQSAGCACNHYRPRKPAVEPSQQVASIASWLKKVVRPVGVFACFDYRGQQVLDACRSLGLVVPEEVGVVAVDNDEVPCELASPPLTSIEPNSRRAGYEAAALLDRMMNGESVGAVELRIAPVGIQRRQSSDALAVEDRQMAAAMRFIREHACESIQVSDALRVVPLSRRVFETRFKASLGITPHDAIVRARLGRVRQLLAETDLSLDEIAERSGFSHPEYMSVVFKREMGVPPGVFRQNLRR